MKTAIIYDSSYLGNTKMVAEAMAGVINANLLTLEEAKQTDLSKFHLLGFGSGIEFAKHNRQIMKFVDEIPDMDKKAFIFSTKCQPYIGKYHDALREKLTSKGFSVIAKEFGCKGFDYTGPLTIFGGLNKYHPNERDLFKAKFFALKIIRLASPLEGFKKRYTRVGTHEGHDVWTLKDGSSSSEIHGTKVLVHQGLCISCGTCLGNCPLDVYDWLDVPGEGKKPDPVRELDCTQCTRCERNCPTGAVHINATWWDGMQASKRHSKRATEHKRKK